MKINQGDMQRKVIIRFFNLGNLGSYSLLQMMSVVAFASLAITTVYFCMH